MDFGYEKNGRWQPPCSDTVSTYLVSSVHLVTDKRSDRSKQCYRSQFAECVAGLLYYS